jgi:hypothetical protein
MNGGYYERAEHIPFGQNVPSLSDEVPLPTGQRIAELMSADESPLNGRPGSAPAPDVEFLTVEDFVARKEQQATALVTDSSGATVIPADGIVQIYGDGGAGKTTLLLDGMLHFTSGVPWLGDLLKSCRPLNVGWIENEGPRDEFLRKIERKLDAWKKERVGSFRVLNRPWSAFDLRRPEHREALAGEVVMHELDLVVIGPLRSIGMQGGGTPDEVEQFVSLLKQVRALVGRSFTFVVIHHDNRAGQVSGAWKPVPDLLVHVQAQGHGKLRIYWEKARWSSMLHATKTPLRWADDEAFALVDAEPTRPERTWDDIGAYVSTHGGCGWVEVEKAVSGQGDYLRRRRDQMLQDGVLVNAGKGQKFALWHRDDPARPTIDATVSEEGHGSDTQVSATGDEGESNRVPVSHRKGDTGRDTVDPASPGNDPEGNPA